MGFIEYLIIASIVAALFINWQGKHFGNYSEVEFILLASATLLWPLCAIPVLIYVYRTTHEKS